MMQGKSKLHCIRMDTLFIILLVFAIMLCISSAIGFLAASGTNMLRFATAEATSQTVNVSYTPTYNTTYVMSIPSNLTISSDSSATSLTISIASWSDFPSNAQLYCDLSSISTLSNGSNAVDMVVKSDDGNVLASGDRVGTFTPSIINSSQSASLAVITVEPIEKPGDGGTYTGTIGLEVGLSE